MVSARLLQPSRAFQASDVWIDVVVVATTFPDRLCQTAGRRFKKGCKAQSKKAKYWVLNGRVAGIVICLESVLPVTALMPRVLTRHGRAWSFGSRC